MYDEFYGEILTVNELAEMLKIGLNTAYNLVKSGEIQSFKVNHSYRIQRSAVIDFIIENQKMKRRKI
ncbi:helix-turn-helix domain-containing protein [Cohnella massiliensis]|uniref:helix-turn-helix domain-containing protein n=1 Tax=Cohnella massiliensis TaxID=1816691 RepID=UPI0009B95916|nr:helix-turn-helix domain-containing protein [Cohnella massiliensis]